MDVLMDDNNLFTRSLSAKNPPPLCVPVPVPYLPIITFDMCMKLFNIYTPGRNLHLCLDLETRLQSAQLLILHFDCMRMGKEGFTLLKPEDNGGLFMPSSSDGPEVITQVNEDIFDEVEVEKRVKENFDRNLLGEKA
jgi:hypothetical protein